MKITKIVIAVILTIILLYIARNNAMNRPRLYTHTENGFTFEYNSVPKGIEDTSVRIPVKITGDFSDDVFVAFRKNKFTQDETTDIRRYMVNRMELVDTVNSIYSFPIKTGLKGSQFYYYFEIRDKTGGSRAKLTMPDGNPFVFKYIGVIPKFIMFGHISLIFATFFFISLAAINSFSLVSGGSQVKPVATFTLWAVILCFLGGYPFGVAMNWYAFSGTWEAVPFGTDFTANKTQLWFVYLLFSLLTVLGTLRGKAEKNLVTSKTFGWISIGSFINMLVIFLIPHSIQFSAGLTKTVCYSYMGLFTLLYLIILFKKKFTKPV